MRIYYRMVPEKSFSKRYWSDNESRDGEVYFDNLNFTVGDAQYCLDVSGEIDDHIEKHCFSGRVKSYGLPQVSNETEGTDYEGISNKELFNLLKQATDIWPNVTLCTDDESYPEYPISSFEMEIYLGDDTISLTENGVSSINYEEVE